MIEERGNHPLLDDERSGDSQASEAQEGAFHEFATACVHRILLYRALSGVKH
jgi:hypothetical protein